MLIEIFMVLPKSPQGKAQLQKEIARFHAEQAKKMIERLPCPTEQKLELLDSVVQHLSDKESK